MFNKKVKNVNEDAVDVNVDVVESNDNEETTNEIVSEDNTVEVNNDVVENISAENENVNIQAPWTTYASMVGTMFGRDNDIKLDYDSSIPKLTLYVNCAIKADSIRKLLPETKTFGNVNLTIDVVPANDKVSAKVLLSTAFAGNPIFSKAVTIDDSALMIGGNTYCLFEKEVIQFYNDDLSDYYGNFNGLAEDIAREIFNEIPKIYYSTEVDNPEE